MSMISDYETNGYFVLDRFFRKSELEGLRDAIIGFHRAWRRETSKHHADTAINSACLTAGRHPGDATREVLFRFIGSDRLMEVVTAIMGDRAAFMNTQLFFDPLDDRQKNYWHRDPQYHLSVEEQQQALAGPDVVHFRIPLFDEPGMELVPGTHRRWDSDEELDVRLEKHGRKNHEALSSAVRVPLHAGDLLVFDANLIHRGLYGMDRLSLDILFCDPAPELMTFVEDSCLPDPDMMAKLENPSAFRSTIGCRTGAGGACRVSGPQGDSREPFSTV